MPWTIEGDFDDIDNHRYMNRQITFANTDRDAVVSEIALCGYRDGEFKIFVYAPNDATYSRLIDRARARGVPPPTDANRRNLELIMTYRIIMPNVMALLQAAQDSEPSFEQIREQINHTLHIVLPPIVIPHGGENRMSALSSLFARPPGIALGDVRSVSRTEQSIECEVCFDTELLPTDDKVITICSHVFHRGCLEKWQKSYVNDAYRQNYNQCPTCRRELLPR